MSSARDEETWPGSAVKIIWRMLIFMGISFVTASAAPIVYGDWVKAGLMLLVAVPFALGTLLIADRMIRDAKKRRRT